MLNSEQWQRLSLGSSTNPVSLQEPCTQPANPKPVAKITENQKKANTPSCCGGLFELERSKRRFGICPHSGKRVEHVWWGIDSGATDTVARVDTAKHFPTFQTEESRSGNYYETADGQKVYSQGGRAIVGLIDGVAKGIECQLAPIQKPLVSASAMVSKGHRVVFQDEHLGGAYCEHIGTGETTRFRTVNGVWEMEMIVPCEDDPYHEDFNYDQHRRVPDIAAFQQAQQKVVPQVPARWHEIPYPEAPQDSGRG